MPVTITVPDIGGAEGAEVVEILVAVGDEIELEQSLIVLESDKASMEIPATAAGKVVELRVALGDALSEGDAVLVLESAGPEATEVTTVAEGASPEANSPAVEAAPEVPSEEAVSATSENANEAPVPSPAGVATPLRTEQPSTDAVAPSAEASVYAGPAVRKLAREFGIDLAQLSGSGPKGRILKEDLHAFSKARMRGPDAAQGGAGLPTVPAIDFAQFGEVESHERSRLDQVTAANMTRSWLNVPHVTQFEGADITDLEAFRESMKKEAEARGCKLTPIAFVLKACAVALAAHPKLKSSLSTDGKQLIYKNYCHLGMAVDTPAGLVVPVIRDVDSKGIWELTDEIREMAEKARAKKLTPAQMQGGVFTISSLGGIGGEGFTPIVNTPEVAILGLSRAEVRPVWDGNNFQPRKVLPLSLSYDHRVINGGDAGRFLTDLAALLADVRRIIM